MAQWDMTDYMRTDGGEVSREAPQTVEELTSLLLARFDYADAYRKQWDEKAQDWWKLYIGWREQFAEDDPRRFRSNIHVPRPYEVLDTYRARLVKSFFGQRPYFDFLPQPSGSAPMNQQLMELNERKAQLAASLVDQQLEKNEIVPLWYEFVTNFLVFPAAVLAVGWRYEEKTVLRRIETPTIDPYTGRLTMTLTTQAVPQVIWDGNELSIVAWEDQWCDPRGADIDKARFFFHRELLTRDQLESKIALLERAGIGEAFPLDWETVQKQGEHLLGEGKWERFSAVGISDPGGDHWAVGEKPGNVVEVLHYWTNDDYGMLINRHSLAWYGANPYWRHGSKPYILCSFEPVTGQPYGISAMQTIEYLAHEVNTQRNQRIDALSFTINAMRKVRRSADIDQNQLIPRPGGIVEVDELDDVADMPMQGIPQSAYLEESLIKQDMENALGTPPVVRGVSASGRETATEIAAKQSNAGIRFEVKIAVYQVKAINRLARLMDLNNQQFIDTAQWVQVYGAEQLMQWQQVEPFMLIGERDYRPAGSNIDPAANREIRRQQIMQLMEIIWKLNIPYVNRYELFRDLIDTFDLRNPSKIILPWQELMQMAQQVPGVGPPAPTEAAPIEAAPPNVIPLRRQPG